MATSNQKDMFQLLKLEHQIRASLSPQARAKLEAEEREAAFIERRMGAAASSVQGRMTATSAQLDAIRGVK